MKRSLVIASSAVLLFAAICPAQSEEKIKISDGVVKIGMIEDMSSIYADITGVGAVTAAKMAVEDFGGTVFGMPRLERDSTLGSSLPPIMPLATIRGDGGASQAGRRYCISE